MKRLGGFVSENYKSWLLWVSILIAGFVLASYITSGIVVLMQSAGITIFGQAPLGPLIARVIVYVVMLFIVVWMPKQVLNQRTTMRQAGIAVWLTWKDVALAPAGIILYAVLVYCLISVARLVPGFDLSQGQNIGASVLYGTDRAIGFIVLVVITPIAEELLFRGVLFGKLRRNKMPFWAASVVVSALFGLAHGQWNVAIDVFCLSMVACYLREITGGIWPGVLMHIIKNTVAFYFMFVITQGL